MFSTLFRLLTRGTAGLAVASAVAAATSWHPSPPAPHGTPVPPDAASRTPDPDVNPPVRPGLVRWHPSFADARAAARRSGRPVLLFHMMGQLDRQFC
jgi:hypothetical protein